MLGGLWFFLGSAEGLVLVAGAGGIELGGSMFCEFE